MESALPVPFKFVLNTRHYVNAWYVYGISTEDGTGTKLRYVGIADARHLMVLPDATSNPKVREHLLSTQFMLIEVFSSHRTQNEARAAAAAIIREQRPLLNQYGIAYRSKKKPVKCVQNNMVFDSVNAAAEWAGVAAPTMSSHLSRRSGYATVRDMTFEYELPDDNPIEHTSG